MNVLQDSWWNISVECGDPSCNGFLDIVRIKRQTHYSADENPTPPTAVRVGNTVMRSERYGVEVC